MDKAVLVENLSALVMALEGGEGAPEGHLYAALGMGATGCIDHGDFMILMNVAERGKLITRESHWVVLTPEGTKMAQKMKAIMAEAKAKKVVPKATPKVQPGHPRRTPKTCPTHKVNLPCPKCSW